MDVPEFEPEPEREECDVPLELDLRDVALGRMTTSWGVVDGAMGMRVTTGAFERCARFDFSLS